MIRTKRIRSRSNGQAMFEGVAFLLILVPIIVAGILLNIVTASLGYYHLKLAQVADAGARAAVNQRYWLGAERPNYDEKTAAANVINTCNTIYTNIGLPGTMAATVDFSDASVVTVTVTASALPVVSGGFLPALFTMQDVASEPYNIEAPIGVMGLDFIGSGNDMGMIFPCYGAGLDQAAGSSTTQMGPGPTSNPWACGANAPYWHASTTSSDTPSPVGGPWTNADEKNTWTSY